MRKKRTTKVITRSDTSPTKKQTEEKKKKAGVGTYRNIPYESQTELHTLFWLFELKNKGYIKKIERSKSFLLCEGVYNYYTESIKRGTSSRNKEQVILRPSSYTPEFYIEWDVDKFQDFVWLMNSNTKFDKCFIGHIGEHGEIYTYVECKSSFDFSNMTRLFINNQKFIYQKYNIFVNLIKPDKLFQKTFLPTEYLSTATGKARKLKFEAVLIDDYLKTLK